MVETLEGADGLVWSSPLYQGSISGSFKNALDWLHLPTGTVYLADKVIGLISVAGGTQGLPGDQHDGVLGAGAAGMGRAARRPGFLRVATLRHEGRLDDEAVERQLKMLGSEVVRVADHFRVEEAPDHADVCLKASERVLAAA